MSIGLRQPAASDIGLNFGTSTIGCRSEDHATSDDHDRNFVDHSVLSDPLQEVSLKIVTCNEDCTIRMFDIKTGGLVVVLAHQLLHICLLTCYFSWLQLNVSCVQVLCLQSAQYPKMLH